MNFIEELQYGNICPNEKCFDRNSAYATALEQFCKCEEILAKNLKGKNLKIFTDLINANSEFTSISSVENFKAGFSLGIKMMCDALFFDDNTVFRDITW